jgi:hypothetical protein
MALNLKTKCIKLYSTSMTFLYLLATSIRMIDTFVSTKDRLNLTNSITSYF